ncbi:MAG: transporter substrate-binding domain-containing protein [Chlamydiia bacterium]|nr:transporter substrate-binding domain-containing protein [Chlamydiia bacterium]
MRVVVLFLLALLSCCSGGRGGSAVRLGVDPNWYPLDFGNQAPYINGFAEDFLIEAAHFMGRDFVRIAVNPGDLLEGLHTGKYDAILSSMASYNFNLAKYDFTENFLHLGPVLIQPVNARYQHLSDIHGDLVGTLTNDPAILVLESYPEILLRDYPSIPELLNAVVSGEIGAALLNRIPAVNYVHDLYEGKLKITGEPLTGSGLHLIALKGKQTKLIQQFNRTLESMQEKQLPLLLRKWTLQ